MPVPACETIHKSTFNIRHTLLLCLLKIIFVLLKLTWIRTHHFLNKISSTPNEAFQQITWFVQKEQKQWPGWEGANTEWIWKFIASHYCSSTADCGEVYDHRVSRSSFGFKDNEFYKTNQPLVIFFCPLLYSARHFEKKNISTGPYKKKKKGKIATIYFWST